MGCYMGLKWGFYEVRVLSKFWGDGGVMFGFYYLCYRMTLGKQYHRLLLLNLDVHLTSI